MTRLSVIGQVTSLWLAVYGPCFTTPHRRHIILTTSEVAMVVGIPEIVACVPKSHQRQTTGIDVKAENIHARVTGQVDSEGRSDA